MGLLERANAARTSSVSLLSRAQGYTAEKKKPGDGRQGIAAEVGSLIREISPLRDSLGNPEQMFSLIARFFAIRKGALLLFDESSGMFVPRALTGYDRTTEHRLRVPVDAVENHVHPGSVWVSEDNESLKPFFSMREYTVLETVVFASVVHGGSIIALLLITECDKISDDGFADALSTVAKDISKKLYASRMTSQEILAEDVFDGTDPETLVQELIDAASRQEKIIFLFPLSMSAAVSALADAGDRSEPYRIGQDITRILSSMVSGIGKLIRITSDRYLLAVTSRSTLSPDLYQHQINQAVAVFFHSEPAHIPLFAGSVLRYPEDGTSPRTLLSSFPV